MSHDDTPLRSGSGRRIYRFHFGWSVCGRVNHFTLTDSAQHERTTGTHGAKICDSGAHNAKAKRVSTSRSGAPETRPHIEGRTTEFES